MLVDGDENVIGTIPTEEALKLAEEKGFDLVEVSPLSSPPVCKLMDYGTYIYGQKKKEQKQKRAQKQAGTKAIRLSIRTGSHDLEVKAKQARKFLEDRNTVKVVVIFKGREMAHGDLAESKLKEFHKFLEDVCVIEQEPKRQGYQMTMMLNPAKN
jgi:translation initiation factor IF-3